MKDKINYELLIPKLCDFCVSCGDNLFMEFVWIQTIKRIQVCDDTVAKTIIGHLKKTDVLKVDGRKLALNRNTHRNMKFMTSI
jgi:hypothetical protein